MYVNQLSQGGQTRVLNHTHAGCIDHTTYSLFYTISKVDNLVVFGADVTNAFGDVPPPKQGLHILPDKAFHEW